MLASFVFIIAPDYAMRTAIDNKLGFTLEERVAKCQPPKIITDTDFADDIALISNAIRDSTPSQSGRISALERSAYQRR